VILFRLRKKADMKKEENDCKFVMNDIVVKCVKCGRSMLRSFAGTGCVCKVDLGFSAEGDPEYVEEVSIVSQAV